MQAATIPKPLPALNIWGYRGFDSNNVARVEVLFDRIDFRNSSGTITGVLTGATGSKVPPGSVNYYSLSIASNSWSGTVTSGEYDIFTVATAAMFFPGFIADKPTIELRAATSGSGYAPRVMLYNSGTESAEVEVNFNYMSTT